MNLKNKKILITGATGGIGNCLVEKFINLVQKLLQLGQMKKNLNFEKKISKRSYRKI